MYARWRDLLEVVEEEDGEVAMRSACFCFGSLEVFGVRRRYFFSACKSNAKE